MSNLRCCVPITAYNATQIATNAPPSTTQLRTHTQNLLNIITPLAQQLVVTHWNQADIDQLASGVDYTGRRLPTKGYVALSRLGWNIDTPAGWYLPSRVERIIRETAARHLRGAVYKQQLVAAVIGTWPSNPGKRSTVEWERLYEALPVEASKVEIRSRTRQIQTYIAKHQALPVGLADLDLAPTVAAEVLLAAADRQYVVLTRDIDGCYLDMRLPISDRPTDRDSWAWTRVPINIPNYIPANVVLHKPIMRLAAKGVRFDLPYDREIKIAPVRGHVRALGLDWGVNTLLTGSVGRSYYDRDGRYRVAVDGFPLVFDATGAELFVRWLVVAGPNTSI